MTFEPRKAMRYSRGFTLIEWMVTISVLAILLSIVVSSFTNLLLANRVQTAKTDVLVALQFARSEAVKRGEKVHICQSANGNACGSATEWAKGWLVEAESGGVLRIWNSVPAGVTISGPATTISFKADGTTDIKPTSSESDAGTDFAIAPSPCSGQTKYGVNINAVGRALTNKGTCQ
ncbi:GspH/FimT family pseudopilin [Stutzerimonas stutzeri]|uniref:GspH/FimT family pseudopilin n=1 Tax=Stutzerimonas stutzeri TaxID=316 RepID=UPI002108B3EB|nr:GspH/FimT family pseudopilin [Stutzerimonas stutzeri]MCQ4322063.1 GspH/FimT family pseudopilin [Stutzerimonas stutzeri]